MMPQAQALYALQQIDLEAREHGLRLKEIDDLLANNEAVRTAQERVTQAEDALKPLRTQNRDLELEIQTTRQKAAGSEERLYSGRVKSPKELQDLQSEIALLKARVEQLQDGLLDVMMATEEAESALEDAKANYDAVLAETQSENSDLLAEKAQLEARVAELMTDREEAIKNVTPQNVKLYDTMKERKGRRPLAAMEGRTCAACGVEQTLAIAQAVNKRDDLVRCENCGRILVAL